MLSRFFFGLYALVFISGCAVGPKYTPAPNASEGNVLVYLMRENVHFGGGYPTKFTINETIVASLYDNGYTWLHIPAGEYVIQGGGKKIEVDLKAGSTHYYKYTQINMAMPSGQLATSTEFREFGYEQVKTVLPNMRYKESTPLAEGRKQTIRSFKNTRQSQNATLRIVRDPAFKSLYPITKGKVYDDPISCKGGEENFGDSLIGSHALNFPAGKKITLSLTVLGGASITTLSCNSKFTVTLEEGKEYELEHKLQEDPDRKDKHFCRVKIKDSVTGEYLKVLSRTTPYAFSGKSPECEKRDFLDVKKSEQTEHKSKCTVYFAGEISNC